MGNASFCPVCGDIVGGWQEEELTPCHCVTSVGPDPNPVKVEVDLDDIDSVVEALVEYAEYAADTLRESNRYLDNVGTLLEAANGLDVTERHLELMTQAVNLIAEATLEIERVEDDDETESLRSAEDGR